MEALEPNILIKTPKGLENVAASRIKELIPSASVMPKPQGYLGIVFVKAEDPEKAAELIKKEVLEAERVLVVRKTVKASLQEIAEAAAEEAARIISPSETFAVRTTRRGKHDFTSIDVNVAVGSAVQKKLGCDVDLEYPDKVVLVEIFGPRALISIEPGSIEHRKKYRGKPDVKVITSKIVVCQMPYIGPLEASYKVGVRVGRGAQSFELKELCIAPHKPVEAAPLAKFIEGVLEGVESRFKIQKATYAHRVRLVPVTVYEMYQFVRMHSDACIIVTSTKGRTIWEVSETLKDLFREKGELCVLIGAREGLPVGLFRRADLTVDVAPGITLPTDHAITACLTAILGALTSNS